MSKMFFNMLAVFAEFEADLLKLRTREGMAIARSRGRLKGKKPKLTARQQAELVRMHATGGYTIAELMEVFSVGRATVYRVLNRATTSTPSCAAVPGPSPDTPAWQAARAQKASATVQPATDTGRFPAGRI
jgi:DNA invertase Pin-like site-specific DNA recombinase